MAGIQLSKGGRINLAKVAPNLTNVKFGLAWGENMFTTGSAYDLDGSVFICVADSTKPMGVRLKSDNHFIFYNQHTDPEQAVVHSGDNRTGSGEGDDETISVDISKLPADVVELSFIVTIHDAVNRKQNFGQIPGSSITMYNGDTGEQISKYSLEDDFSSATAVQFGSLKKNNSGEWQFIAAGNGYDKGLADFVVLYGGTLA